MQNAQLAESCFDCRNCKERNNHGGKSDYYCLIANIGKVCQFFKPHQVSQFRKSIEPSSAIARVVLLDDVRNRPQAI